MSNRPIVNVSVNGHTLRCLFDTGAAISGVSAAAATRAGLRTRPLPASASNLQSADGSAIPCTETADIFVLTHGATYKHSVRVIPNLNIDLILGIDFIKLHKVEITGTTLTINNNTTVFAVETNYAANLHAPSAITVPAHSVGSIRIKTPFRDCNILVDPFDSDSSELATISTCDGAGYATVTITNTSAERITIPKHHLIGSATRFNAADHIAVIDSPKGNDSLANPHSDKIVQRIISKIDFPADPAAATIYKSLVRQYSDVFAASELDIGWSDAVSHRINLKSSAPVFTRQYKIPLAHQEVIEQFVQDMLQRNLIETARSRFNSPIFCVRKKNGKWRPVIDLRRVNKATVDDFYSIKDIRTCLDTIGTKHPNVFSSMDLQSGFLQQNLDPKSRPYTAFTVPNLGQYQFRVSCFGAHGAPSSFSSLIDHIFTGVQNLVTYIDDLLTFTKGHQHQIATLEEVFRRLRRANLKLNPEKCRLGQDSVEYLGYLLTKDGIKPTHDKLGVIRNAKPPTNPKEIRQFLGLAGFFREHIHHFAHKSSKLSRLTRKDSTWKKGPLPQDALQAFQQLKKDLLSEPIISYARPELPYELFCDAATGTSNNQRIGGLGAVLTQLWPEDGKRRVIGYASRQAKDHETRYSPTNMEMAAIVFGIQHFHHYLYGAKHFVAYTDHKPVADSTAKAAEAKDKTLLRLQDKLLQYNFDVVYRPGKDMGAPDFLSRAHSSDAIIASVEATDSALEILQMHSDQVANLQRLDPYWGPQLQAMENGKTPPRLPRQPPGTPTRVHGVLFYALNNKLRLATPDTLVHKVLTFAHDSTAAGHKDTTKTLHRIRNNFLVKNAYSTVANYIKTCHTCQISKSYGRTTNPMSPLPTPSMFNERVHVDLVGPLSSAAGYTYILTMRDAFSRYQQFAPLKDKSAASVAKALVDKWLAPFGAMTSMTSDNGKEWVNKIIEYLCRHHNIHHILTTPYYPPGNAIGERQHRELNDFLRALLKDTDKWPELLNYAAMAHNTQFNESIGHSPYYTVFFREHPGLFNKLMPPETRSHWTSADVSHMLHARFLTRQAIERATEKQRRYYDRKAKLHLYRPGDLVLRWNDKAGNLVNRKLLNSWTGPYIVVDAPTTGNTVQISTPIGESKTWVNKNKLKFYFSSQAAPTQQTQPTQQQPQQPPTPNDDDYTPVLPHRTRPDHTDTPTPSNTPTSPPASPSPPDTDGFESAPEHPTQTEETDTENSDDEDPHRNSPSHNLRDRSKLQRPARYRNPLLPGDR